MPSAIDKDVRAAVREAKGKGKWMDKILYSFNGSTEKCFAEHEARRKRNNKTPKGKAWSMSD